MTLIPEWKTAHKLWTVQLAVFWMLVSAGFAALPAFMNYVSPINYALLCVGFSATLLIARLTDQPGVEG